MISAQFFKKIGSAKVDIGRDIAVSNSSIYITGSYESTVNFGGISQNGNDTLPGCFFARYDKNGNIIWVKTLNYENTSTFGRDVFIDDSDNSTYYNVQFQDIYGYCAIMFGKVDSIGNLKWHFVSNYDESNPERGFKVVSFKATDSSIRILITLSDINHKTLYYYDTLCAPINCFNYTDADLIYLEINKKTGVILSQRTFIYPNLKIRDALLNGDSVIISGYFVDSTKISNLKLNATTIGGTLKQDAIVFCVSIVADSCVWYKQLNSLLNDKEEADGLVIINGKIYFLHSYYDLFYMHGLSCSYDPYANSFNEAPVSELVSYSSTQKIRIKKIANDKVFVLFDKDFTTTMGVSSFVFNINSLLVVNNFISVPVGVGSNTNNPTLCGFDADLDYLYIIGYFGGTISFDGQQMTSSASTTGDIFFLKKKYCFYPPTVSLVYNHEGAICATEQNVQLVGTPAGGSVYGPYTNGLIFHPNLAGIGSHKVSYQYTDLNNCLNADTIDIYVDACTSITELSTEKNVLDHIIVFNALGQFVLNTNSIVDINLPKGIYVGIYVNTKGKEYQKKKFIAAK